MPDGGGLSTQSPIDIDELRKAIGRVATASDLVTPQQCRALRATLDQDPDEPGEGEDAPPAIHWCLAQPAVPMHEIGPDGHPARGGFLPAVPLPRRMWAGGRLDFAAPLKVGDRVTRASRIADVVLKQGRTGPLVFVTVVHDISTGRGAALEERQDIVYRGAERPGVASAPAAGSGPARVPRWTRTVKADPVLLFRYSALTFNGHRIHYDRTYATGEEGYPGLVVHGPLQATLLLTLAAEERGMPRSFEFRSGRPLFDGADFTVNAEPAEDRLEFWVADHLGQPTMTATATW